MGKPTLRNAKVTPLIKTSMPRTRSFRIVYDDPDATESSGDEGGGDISRRKRKVQEFRFAACPLKTISAASTRSSISSLPGKRKHKGVRLRPSGRWAAEIRRPVGMGRFWLGTFPTETEAIEAYRAAARRLHDEESCGSAGSVAGVFLPASLPPLDEVEPLLLTGVDDVRTGVFEPVGLPDAFGLGFDSLFLQGELSAEFWPGLEGDRSVAVELASTAEIEEIFAN